MNTMTPDSRHQHLIVRAEVARPPMAEDCDAVCEWMSDLIRDIGMKELAPPRARYCEMPGNRGMTADAIIETSHCVIHTWDECSPAIVQFDLYSCSKLDPRQVINHLGIFQPRLVEYKFLDREGGLRLISNVANTFPTFLDRVRAWIIRLVD